MKKGSFEAVLKEIDEILKNSKEEIVNWYLIQNKNMIKKEKEVVDEYKKPTDKIIEYERKRIDLCMKYCTKDENGNAKIIESIDLEGNKHKEFQGLRNNKEFEEKFQELNKEYENEITEFNNKQNCYETTIKNEEVEFKFKKIKLSQLKNVMNGYQMELLSEMIQDDFSE